MYSTQGWKTGVPLTENTEPTCTVSTKPTATNAHAPRQQTVEHILLRCRKWTVERQDR